MSSRMFSAEQKAKLNQIMNEGMAVMQEVEDLNAGLDRKSTRLNSSHIPLSRMPSSA